MYVNEGNPLCKKTLGHVIPVFVKLLVSPSSVGFYTSPSRDVSFLESSSLSGNSKTKNDLRNENGINFFSQRHSVKHLATIEYHTGKMAQDTVMALDHTMFLTNRQLCLCHLTTFFALHLINMIFFLQ